MQLSKVNGLSLLSGMLVIGVGIVAGGLVIDPSNLSKLVVVIMGGAVIAATIARVEWGLLALVFMTYTNFSNVLVNYHGAPSVAKPFIFLFLLVILIRWWWYGERPVGWEWAALLMTAYGLAGAASLLSAVDFARAQYALTDDYAKDALLTIIVVILLQRTVVLRRVIWTLLAAGGFLGTLSVYQYLTGTLDQTYWGFGQAEILHIAGEINDYRLAGPLGDANHYAHILLPLIPLALDRLWSEKTRLLRLVAAWALAVCGLSLVFTFSRSSFIGLVVVVGLMFIWRPPRLSVLLITLVLIIPLLQFVPAHYTTRIKTLVETLSSGGSSTDASMQGRLSENIVGWQMWMDHPLLGVGLQNSPLLYQRYARQVGLDLRHEDRGTHNLYLQIAAETGVLGLTTFSLLLWVMFRGMQRARAAFVQADRLGDAAIVTTMRVAIIGYLVNALFLNSNHPRYFWLLVGIALALPQIVKNEVEAEETPPQSSPPNLDGQPTEAYL